MALQNNFIPSTTLVFTPRDYAQQIMQNQADDTRAVQNAFKFGTHVYDFLKSREQAKLMRQDAADRDVLQNRINNDKAMLAELKAELESLQNGGV
jgi:hypothetical protein